MTFAQGLHEMAQALTDVADAIQQQERAQELDYVADEPEEDDGTER